MAGKPLIFIVVMFVFCQARGREYCRDSFGSGRQIYAVWAEGDKLCECLPPWHVHFFWKEGVPANPITNCLWNGCPNPSGGAILKAGDIFLNEQGDRCTCTHGPDPNLLDASLTLFHADCSPV